MSVKSNKGSSKMVALSVVIPTYNGEKWLPATIDHVLAALRKAQLDTYEIVVIDDGSTDDTVKAIKSYAKTVKQSIKVVSQENAGRFSARNRGTREARYDLLLFVDTRVFIGENSLKYALKEYKKDQTRKVWCSHVRVKKEGNIYARFWEAFGFIAWRKYFKNPRDVSYTVDKFDDYPKGTTCFLVDRSVLQNANDWFVKNTKDIKDSNDDTLLLRYIAVDHTINISPNFWCLYHARNTLRQYSKHVFHRGKVFVDGFLRNDGNRYYMPLLIGLALSALLPFLVVALLLFKPLLVVAMVLFAACLWVVETPLLLALGVPLKDALSFTLLTPVFTVYYTAGIWTAFIKISVLNRQKGANG